MGLRQKGCGALYHGQFGGVNRLEEWPEELLTSNVESFKVRERPRKNVAAGGNHQVSGGE